MKRIFISLAFLFPSLVFPQVIDLSGTWKFSTDSTDIGILHGWQNKKFSEDVKLPGSMTTNDKGLPVTVDTKWTGWVANSSWYRKPQYEKYRQPGNVKIIFWLQPQKTYVGPAWYTREFFVAPEMKRKQLILTLERVHWESTVWIDGKMVGMQNSLSTAHIYYPGELKPGRHTITVRVDNRIKDIDMGMNAHSVSDQTQTNWNGIAGSMKIEAKPTLFIKNIRVFPDIDKQQAKGVVVINNTTGSPVTGNLELKAESKFAPSKHTPEPLSKEVIIPAGISEVEMVYPMGDNFYKWDEFTPFLYEMHASFTSNTLRDESSVTFGMRKLTSIGTRFSVNDRPIFLRGTLDCAVFPRTGYPATEVSEWRRIFTTLKDHGLNHVRFHSWCPPEAAFQAADQIGIYFQVEGAGWTAVGNGGPYDKYIYAESERIMEQYGNHPSFLLYTYGNEPNGDNIEKFLGGLITHLKSIDPRHLYTSAAGWPIIPENDYYNNGYPRIYVWYAGLASYINANRPSTNYDWYEITNKFDIPYVSHEVGDWCVFPNFKEIDKYEGGAVRAKNFEVFREMLDENGLAHLADSFLLASGKLQTLCYKADIEAALKTKDFAGFQLLSLQDFPGQGTALVGVLDAFWEQKGYVTPSEFKRFSGETVPLVRLPKMIYSNRDTLETTVEVAHFGQLPLHGVTPSWVLSKSNGEIVSFGNLGKQDISIGNCIQLGTISYPLASISEPEQLKLKVNILDKSNDWDIWVYPSVTADPVENICITDTLDQKTIQLLQNGGKVLFTPKKGSVSSAAGGDITLGFSTIFWNTAWTVHQQPPYVFGVLVNPQHPAFNLFPTEYHSNYQWWDAMMNANAIKLDALDKNIQPIVRVIDDWFQNYSLGLVIEANVGKGKMIISGIDLLTDSENRPEARQLTRSLTNYMSSDQFNPSVTLTIEKIQSILRQQ